MRYSVSAEREFTSVCHCEDCRRHSGSAFAVVTMGRNQRFRCRDRYGRSARWPIAGGGLSGNFTRNAARRFCWKSKRGQERPLFRLEPQMTRAPSNPRLIFSVPKPCRGCRFPKRFGSLRESPGELVGATPGRPAMEGRPLTAPNQNPGRKYECTAKHHLKRRREGRRLHVAPPNPTDDC